MQLSHSFTICHIRHPIDCDIATFIVCAIVSSHIDYYNFVIYGVTAANITRLQRIHIQLTRVVCKASYRSSYIGCIDYKILTTVYVLRQRRQPKYLLHLLTDYAPVRTFRSSNANLLTPPPCQDCYCFQRIPGHCPKTVEQFTVVCKI